jgi:hypothetical protein
VALNQKIFLTEVQYLFREERWKNKDKSLGNGDQLAKVGKYRIEQATR